MAIDATVLALLDQDLGSQVRGRALQHEHDMNRLSGSFDQDGRAVGAAIASVMIQASIPEQAMNNKLADRTPSPPAQPEPPNPKAA